MAAPVLDSMSAHGGTPLHLFQIRTLPIGESAPAGIAAPVPVGSAPELSHKRTELGSSPTCGAIFGKGSLEVALAAFCLCHAVFVTARMILPVAGGSTSRGSGGFPSSD